MFCCVEIRKAPNTPSCQCETWRDASRSYVWVCTLRNVYVGRHVPFVSQLSETQVETEHVHYHITVSSFVDVGCSFLRKMWLQTFDTFILEDCIYF